MGRRLARSESAASPEARHYRLHDGKLHGRWHATEPAPINAFRKSPSAIIGHGDTMVLPDVPATIFEGEAEGCIGYWEKGGNVPAAQALD